MRFEKRVKVIVSALIILVALLCVTVVVQAQRITELEKCMEIQIRLDQYFMDRLGVPQQKARPEKRQMPPAKDGRVMV